MVLSWKSRVAAVATLVVAAVGFGNVPANAGLLNGGVSLQPAYSNCVGRTTTINWWGGFQFSPWASPWDKPPKGTVILCLYVYQIADQDSTADYYAAEAQSIWTLTSGPAEWQAAMNTSITSNVAAKSQVYDATNTFTSSQSCSSAITVGLNLSIFSLSSTPSVCSGFKVSRASYSTTGAFWSSPFAGGLRSVEPIYVQKVGQGVKPTFTAAWGIPQYYTSYSNGFWYTTSHLVYQSLSGKKA